MKLKCVQSAFLYMVLESLFPDKAVKSKPLDMLILSAIVAFASIFVAHFVFPKYAGIITPLLIAVGMAPLIFRLFEDEEEEIDEVAENRISAGFLQRHADILLLFSMMFTGSFLAIFFVAAIMPVDFVDSVFEPQISDIRAVQSMGSGAMFRPDVLVIILLNNFKVMAFAFVLSFLFGTGAVFILGWNASILAIYLANIARSGMYDQLLLTTTGILPHAIVELTAYFLAGIAGGLLSVGMIREKWGTPEFRLVFRDSVILMGVAVFAVAAGAVIEVGL